MPEKSTYKIILPYLFIVIITIPLLFYGKGHWVEYLNELHTPLYDAFFVNVSRLGNGAFIVLWFVLVLLRFQYKWVSAFVLGFVIHLILVHLFKQWLAFGAPRPYVYFEKTIDQYHLIDGVTLRLYESFPSGHTATIFFIASFFSIHLQKYWSWIFMVIAFAVGISRVYLFQHFFIDVYFGMFFGILSTVIAYFVVNYYHRSWYDKRWINYFK